MKTRFLIVLTALIVCAFAAIFPNSLSAQTGTIQGTVKNVLENTGIPGAKITLFRSGTNERVTGAISNAKGEYVIQNVALGKYDLLATVIGYDDVKILNLSIEAGQPLTQDVSLIQSSIGLEELIVTASRQPVRKIETITAVDVIGAKELTLTQPATISDAIRYTPGIFVVSYAGRVRSEVYARGLPDGENLIKYTTLLIDGLPSYASSVNPPDAFFKYDLGIERVEVVRGNAATLFGRSAAGGVVNVITKTGGNKLHGIAQVTYGTSPFGGAPMLQGDVNLNGPIADAVRFNLTAMYLNDGGYRNSGFPDRGYQVRANVDFLLSGAEKLSNKIRIYGGALDMNVMNNVDIPYDITTLKPASGWNSSMTMWSAGQRDLTFNVPRDANGGFQTYKLSDFQERGNYSRGFHAGLKFDYDFGEGWTITNNFRFQQMAIGLNFAFNAAFNKGAGVTFQNQTIDNTVANQLQYLGDTFERDIVNELQIRKSLEIGTTKHFFTLGGYFSNNRNNPVGQGYFFQTGAAAGIEKTPNATAIGFAPVPIPQGNNGVTRSTALRNGVENNNVLAVFVGDEMKLTQELSLNIGFRYDQTAMDLNEFARAIYRVPTGVTDVNRIGGQFYSTGTNVNRQITIGDYSISAGANYLLTEKSAVYANFLRSFRAPDEDVFTPAERITDPLTGAPSLDPNAPWLVPAINNNENILTLEAGYRASFLDGDFTLDIAGFMTTVNNRLVQTFTNLGGASGTPGYATISQGSTRVLGAEISLLYAPDAIKGLTLRANATPQNSIYTDFTGYVVAQGTAARAFADRDIRDATGKQVARLPNFIWNVVASYEGDFFGVNVSSNYAAGRYAEPMNLLKLDDLWQLDAGAFVKFKLENAGTVRLDVRCSNLLGMETAISLRGVNPTFAQTQVQMATPAASRFIGGLPMMPRRIFVSLSYSF
jgi:iron complex outermembrane receptor protein